MPADPRLVQRVMLLSHERGLELDTEEVLNRAEKLVKQLRDKGLPADTVYALKLMIELLDSTHGQ